MRIGIITHHYIKNYGAFLQAYALQEIIKNLYPDARVEITNYINKKHYLVNLRPFILSKPQSDRYKAVRLFFESKRQLLQFNQAVKKYLNLSPICWGVSDINKL